MVDLVGWVDDKLRRAFARASLPVEGVRSVPATRPEFGDFQCNAAMALGKAAKRNPRDLAAAVAETLRADPDFASVEVAGPGFLNLRLADGFVAGLAREQAASPTLGIVQTGGAPVLLDFGGANVAKPLHVGHLRSLVIGESLSRIFQAQGLETVSDVHFGDWGLQMGMLIGAIRRAHPGRAPGTVGEVIGIDEMQRLYPEAAAACKADPGRMAEARALTAALQGGDAEARADWAALRATSFADQKGDFDRLGAHFDLYLGESDVQATVDRLVPDLMARGVAERDDGAVVIAVAEPSDTKQIPPLMLEKSDGAATYGTTDLATIADRPDNAESRHCGRYVYVVDERQSLHFTQVFRAARRAGLAPGVAFTHVGFGTVNGLDGKPYKTREGGVARLRDLLDEAVAKARERVDASDPDVDAEELAQQVGLAAVKWADLSTGRLGGYVFNLERMMSFEGNTGPYVQYACVRIGAIAARAKAAGAEASAIALGHPAERALAMACLGLPNAVEAAAAGAAPNEIAGFAFAVAQSFSRFYTECPVLAAGEDERAARLALCELAFAVLSRALWMLGIAVPRRM
ncbi:arginine--tRNA ligase [Lichenibacterium dinghuense]|uniref:arginine--tRNA ligase n=1 Tax=Lichenibacterium dinghuense TaxID=2895977 RepID=UPI001EFFF66C|nr:arginine--tRNA ligase [Lichenibacterium sp. 6Y81]